MLCAPAFLATSLLVISCLDDPRIVAKLRRDAVRVATSWSSHAETLTIRLSCCGILEILSEPVIVLDEANSVERCDSDAKSCTRCDYAGCHNAILESPFDLPASNRHPSPC